VCLKYRWGDIVESKYLKVSCKKHNKWFAIEAIEFGGEYKAINFVNLSEQDAEIITTEISDTRLSSNDNLRSCCKCNNRKVGCCDHIQSIGLCNAPYNFQCLYCNELRINYQGKTVPYSQWVGVSNIPGATADRFGNPLGNEYDLAKDGSFDGYKIVILCLYTGEGILDGIKQPIYALKKKGFEVVVISTASPNELSNHLKDACQLWIVSNNTQLLDSDHLRIIKEFYEQGYGLYIWGDNEPYYADANFISNTILGCTMFGNTMGDQVVGVQQKSNANSPGIVAGHPITTGIVNIYEGITIATVNTNINVKPLIISSANQVVTAFADANNRRALVDGGFTRLFIKWDSAGTDRYIVNATAWLANIEHWGYKGQEKKFT